jgi:hypothetical protein
MRTTLDIPDDLYRQVKARAALEGKSVREVTTELYGRWLAGRAESRHDGEEWLARWVKLGDSLTELPQSPTVREILEEDRNRLESR